MGEFVCISKQSKANLKTEWKDYDGLRNKLYRNLDNKQKSSLHWPRILAVFFILLFAFSFMFPNFEGFGVDDLTFKPKIQNFISGASTAPFQPQIIFEEEVVEEEIFDPEPDDTSVSEQPFVEEPEEVVEEMIMTSSSENVPDVKILEEEAPSLIWDETYGVSGEFDGCEDLALDDQGNIILVGPKDDEASIWVLKLNSIGDHIWNETFSTTGNLELATSVQVHDDYNITVFGGYEETSMNGIVIRYDSEGNYLWNETYRDPSQSSSIEWSSGLVDDTNNITVVGSAFDNFTIFRYSPDGEPLWDFSIGGGVGENSLSGAAYDHDEIIAVGTDYGSGKLVIFRLDPDGNLMQNSSFAIGLPSNVAQDVVVDEDSGDIFITGYNGDPSSDINYTAFILKLNSSFDYQWNDTVGSDMNDLLYAIDVDSYGDLVAVGKYNATYDDLEDHIIGGDLWVVKWDSWGDLIWDFTLGEAGTGESAMSVQIDDNDSPFVCGYKDDGGGADDMWVMQFEAPPEETNVSECGNFNVANTAYTMIQDVSSTGTCFTVNANNVTLDCAGYNITYSTSSAGEGINITGANLTTIKNCQIFDSGSLSSHGIYVYSSQNVTVVNNSVKLASSSSNIGIFLEGSYFSNVTGNYINTSDGSYSHGLLVSNSNNNIVSSNKIKVTSSNSVGLVFSNSGSSLILGNDANSTYNYGFRDESTGSQYNDFIGNNFTGTIGVRFKDGSFYSDFINNTIFGYQNGVSLQATSYHVFDGNDITGNTFGVSYGFYVYDGSSYINITRNNITTLTAGSSTYAIYISQVNPSYLKENTLNAAGRDLYIYHPNDNYRTFLINQSIQNYSFSGARISIENTSLGKVDFGGITEDGNLSEDFSLESNSLFVNSTLSSGLNVSANITFYNVGDIDHQPLVDWGDNGIYEVCPSSVCTELSDTETTYTFNVTHFTTYSSNETPIPEDTNVSQCRNLAQANTVYTLNQSFDNQSSGSCIIISAENITFDCAGYRFTGPGYTLGDNAIYVNGFNYTTIKNCGGSGLSGHHTAIKLINSSNTTVTGTTFSVSHYSLDLDTSISCLISNNTFSGALYAAIALDYSSDNNEFVNNYIDISPNSGSPGIKVHRSLSNSFVNTSIGVLGGNSRKGISFISASNNTFNDTTFRFKTLVLDVWIGGNSDGSNVFFNTTFESQNVTDFGSIRLEEFNYSDTLAVTDLDVQNNSAFVNTTKYSWLNSTGVITLNELSFTEPLVYVDVGDTGTFIECNAITDPACNNLSWEGSTFVFNVSHFTSYRVQEGPAAVPQICGNLDTANTVYTMTQDVNSSTTCFNISADNVTLDCAGFLINGTGGGSDKTGIDITRSVLTNTNITIKNCNIKNFDWYGVGTENAAGNYFLDNNFTSNDVGIYVYLGSHNVIERNNLSFNGGKGIDLDESDNNSVYNNTAFGNSGYGIYIDGTENRVVDNIFQENEDYDFFVDGAYNASYCNTLVYNLTGSNNLPIKFYNETVNLENEVLSELFLCNASLSTLNNITINGSQSIKNNGLVVARSSYVNITNSTSIGNREAIYLEGVNSYFRIENNNLGYSNNGLYITNYLSSLDNHLVIRNNFEGNSDAGLYILRSNNSVISDNTFLNDADSIEFSYSGNNTVFNNTFEKSDVSAGYVFRFSRSPLNLIYNNFINYSRANYLPVYSYQSGINFYNTTQQAGARVYSGGLEIGGNYWTNSSGTGFSDTCDDIDTDGFCDDIYNLTAENNNTDYLALSDEFEGVETNISSCGQITFSNIYYTLNQSINSSETCLDVLANNVTIDCQGNLINRTDTGGSPNGIEISRSTQTDTNITIKNCTIKNYETGIYVHNSSNNYLAHNNLVSNNLEGIYLESSHDNVIEWNNASFNVYEGILVSASSNNSIYNNTCFENSDGISLYGTGNRVVDNMAQENSQNDLYVSSSSCNNVVSNFTGSNGLQVKLYNYTVNMENEVLSGLFLCNASYSTLNNVTVNGSQKYNNNGFTIIMSSYVNITNSTSIANKMGIRLFLSPYSRIENNDLSDSSQQGLYLIYSNDTLITGNNFRGNFQGIYSLRTNSSVITQNTFLDNGEGIRLYSSEDNLIYNNTFEGGGTYPLYLRDSGMVLPNLIYNNLINHTSLPYFQQNYTNLWNATQQAGTRIFGEGTQIGGNYWTNSSASGYSDTCADADNDGFCDVAYNLTANNTDYLALSDEFVEETAPQICGNLDIANTTYTMTQNVSSDGTCFNVMANNVTLDCAGYLINYSQSSTGYGINISGYNVTTIRNCNIFLGSSQFSSHAVYTVYSKNTTLVDTNITIQGGSSTSAFYASYGINHNITNLNAFTHSTEAVYFIFGVHNSSLSYSNITGGTVMSLGGDGAAANRGNQFIGNIIDRKFSSDAGISASKSHNSIINYNNLSGGISIAGSSNNIVIGNRIITNASTGINFGYYDGYSRNNTLINNYIYVDYIDATGIQFSQSRNNNVTNTEIEVVGSRAWGLSFVSDTANNTLTNTVLTTSKGYFEKIAGSYNESLINTTFKGSYASLRYPGEINFKEGIVVNRTNVNITNSSVYVNSTYLSFFNTSAEITLEGLNWTNPQVLVDFNDDGGYEVCPSSICSEVDYNGSTYVFNVTQFTTYSSNETPPTEDTNVSFCPRTLGVENTNYTLNQSINSSGSCLIITASNVSLDCQGYTINYSQAVDGVGVNVTANFSHITNCDIIEANSTCSGSCFGIYLSSGITNMNITNNTIRTYSSTSDAIYFADQNMNNSVSENNITVYGGGSKALMLTAGQQNSIFDNVLRRVPQSSSDEGLIFLASAQFTSIADNDFFFDSPGSLDLPVYFMGSNFNLLQNNTLRTGGNYLYFDTSSYNYIFNNTFVGDNGSVNFLGNIEAPDGKRVNRSGLNISYNYAFLNSTNIDAANISFLNVSAEITLEDLSFTEPLVYVDVGDTGSYSACNATTTPECNNLSWDGSTFRFNVSHFTSYRVQEGQFYVNVTDCMALDQSDTIYTLPQNIITSYTGTCLPITANNVTLDCQGYTLDGPSLSSGTAISIGAYNDDIVRDCGIYDFSSGIVASSSTNYSIIGTIFKQSIAYLLTLSNADYGIIANSTFVSSNNAYEVFKLQSGSDYNQFINNDINVQTPVWAPCIYLDGASHNIFRDTSCYIRRNTGASTAYGIRFRGSTENNTFYDTTFGLKDGYALSNYISGSPSGIANGFYNTTFNSQTGSYGSISLDGFNYSNIAFGSSVLNADSNSAFVNTTLYSWLNSSGTITLNSLAFTEPRAYVDVGDTGTFSICNSTTSPACVNLSWDGSTFVFNVSHFTTYRVQEAQEANAAPQITQIFVDSSIVPEEAGVVNVSVNFTVLDADGAEDINVSTAQINFSIDGEDLRENTSCLNVSSAGDYMNFSCAVGMWYFDDAGDWNITAYVEDDLNEAAINDSHTFTYQPLKALVFSPSLLSWSGLSAGSTNATAAQNLTLNNTGNVNIVNVSIKAYDLVGESDSNYMIYSENFTASNNSANLSCVGDFLANDTGVNITGAILFSGNLSDGEGQELLHFCIPEVPSPLVRQTYSTTNGNAWRLSLYEVLAMFALSRRKRRLSKRKEQMLKELELLKSRYGADSHELMSLMQQEDVGEINVPISLFNVKVMGPAESLVKHLKENEGLKSSEIAELMNRDDRTIWSTYKNAVSKKEKIVIKKKDVFVPLNIFSNRKLSILESLVKYLIDGGMGNLEIANLIGKDQRNIGTLKVRLKKKLKKR
ncbi:NosD domain-containing protein [Nanoarchaeota archaeon]